jgi:pyruvate,water dikinase
MRSRSIRGSVAHEIRDPVRGESEPGRFWTMTNLSEATPDVLSPLGWSVWNDVSEVGWLRSMQNFGVLNSRGAMPDPDPNTRGVGVFYGRQAINVDAVRAVVARLPGLSADDFERDLMGSVRDVTPNEKGAPSRIPVIAVKAPMALLKTGARLRTAFDETQKWWVSEVYDASVGAHKPSLESLDSLFAARDRFKEIFAIHCTWRFVFQVAQSTITSAAEKAGDPKLSTDLMSGVGGVLETRMADDLWRVAHGEATEDEFLREHGFHGPNEGNLFTHVWRENPEPVRLLVHSYALRGTGSERPRDREARAMQAREQAEQRMLAASPAVRRPFLRWLFRRSANIVRTLQIGKAAYLMAIDGCRFAARRLGEEQVAEGRLNEVDDVFFLTLDELRDLSAGRLTNAGEMIGNRRKSRAEYKALSIPVTFEGMPQTTPLVERGAGANRDRSLPIEIGGVASGGGVVEGRARVVLDPADEIELEEGDVLVCRFTDPSWAPIMSLAEALVIDIGGSASHGAVVARELGIPYVIGTGTGTATLEDGDRVVVDGEHNIVRVIG